MSLADQRIDYGRHSLDEASVDPDPIVQFERWYAEAMAAKVPEPNAMTLATATPGGVPEARIVLLKGVTAAGFTFFTDYRSPKAIALGLNPVAALVFFWQLLERQVRIIGRVERIAPAESAEYFHSRPHGSQLGAWTSRQSSVLPDRATLEAALAETEARYAEGAVPYPEHWGGFRVVPEAIEFWQGRSNRLHDRIRYRRAAGGWERERLSP